MRVYISAIIAALILAGSPAVLRAQSLADVARKEQERRKTVKPAGKVLTKDLGGADGASAAAADAAKPARRDGEPPA